MLKTRISLLIIVFISGALFIPLRAQKKEGPNKLYPILYNYARNLYPEYDNIPPERRYILEEIANYILGSIQFDGRSDILIVGTNNATRSIMVEAWANAAAYYYGIDKVNISSGGINPEEIKTKAILALEKAGFIIYKGQNTRSSYYDIKYSYNIPPLTIRSKKYNDKGNPDFKFGAIVVCSNADINLPVIKGNNFRTSLHYFDPIAYENTPDALDEYIKRSENIAVEMFYLFYKLKNAK